ncbi:MAG: HAMP domain-containing sensor histidine kinase [Patescibacteria group bacterium]|jgi:signal transduction histidine kinase
MIEQTQFISIVSHQLRTPASTMKWYLETLLENRHGNPINDWQRDKLHQVYQSNERMISLINDLLNVSRLEAGKLMIKPTAVVLATVVNPVLEELLHFAHANNVEITAQLPSDLPAVSADGDKLREVCLNLVSNAIKYSQRGHRPVIISARVVANMVECAVKDEGIGMSDEAQTHLFEKFFRADNAIELQTEGSGLGMYIAREIIRLHGGDIRVVSTLNQGTTVYFTLPIYETK